MKKLIIIIIIALSISISIYLFILHLNNLNSQKGALQVTSFPNSKVYLDDKYIGRTPVSKTEAADMIRAGNYTIKLIPDDKNLGEYQEKISILSGILTVVDRKFNKGLLSEGYVITLSPLNEKNGAELEVISFPSASKISLDSDTIGQAPLLYKKPTVSDHILTISKDGYNEKAIRVRTPKGFRLTVIAYLSVSNIDHSLTSQNSSNSAVPASSITPTPPLASPSLVASSSAKRVTILDTPTGFLRVRQSGSINSAQITTVNPGSTFPMISEITGWFEIKLNDGRSGWISSDYAKKE